MNRLQYKLGQRDDYLFYRKDLNEVRKLNEKGDEEHKSVNIRDWLIETNDLYRYIPDVVYSTSSSVIDKKAIFKPKG